MGKADAVSDYDAGTGLGTGLGGLNFLATGADRFVFEILASHNATLTIDAYSDDTHRSRSPDQGMPDSASPQSLEILFSGFTEVGPDGPVDFSNIGKISIYFDIQSTSQG